MTTLLAVDDSKTMRKVLEITFSGETFETRIAANANDAFTQLAERSISIALVDITLGEQSGYDVCRRIKSEYPAVKVLLLSSKQSPYDTSRGVSSGADDHLDKPFDTQVLLDKVRSLLSRIAAQPAPQPAAAPPAGQMTLAPSLEKTKSPAFPVTSDSKIPTAMPEAPTDELLDDEGPLLIPIEDDLAPQAPAPITVAPVVAEPAPVVVSPVAVAASGAIANKGPEPTMPTAVSANGRAFGTLESKLSALGLTEDQVAAVLALSREVVEAAVWEVVPTLAETLIKEEIRRLTA